MSDYATDVPQSSEFQALHMILNPSLKQVAPSVGRFNRFRHVSARNSPDRSVLGQVGQNVMGNGSNLDQSFLFIGGAKKASDYEQEIKHRREADLNEDFERMVSDSHSSSRKFI